MSDGLPDHLLVIAKEIAALQHRRRLLLAQRSANSRRMIAEIDRREAEYQERLRQAGRDLGDYDLPVLGSVE